MTNRRIGPVAHTGRVVTGAEPELAAFLRGWRDRLPRSTALTDADRLAVVDGIRRCYEMAGVRWPGRVVWAASPAAGIRQARRLGRRRAGLGDRWRARWMWSAGVARAAGTGAMEGGTLGFLSGAGLAACTAYAGPDGASTAYYYWSWLGGLAAALGFTFMASWVVATSGGAARGRWHGQAFQCGLIIAVAAIFVAWYAQPHARTPSFGWAASLVCAMVLGTPLICALAGAVVASLGSGSPPPLGNHARSRIVASRADAFSPLTPPLPDSSVDAGMRTGGEAEAVARVRWAARRTAVHRLRGEWFGGRDAWVARATFLAERGDERLSGFAATGPAGWWWPHTRFVLIGEPPVELRTETAGGIVRLHSPDGPAVRWSDGYGLHFWHGVHLPAALAQPRVDVARIHRHPNTEVRRAAIERLGWATYVERAGWHLIATAPDPGNKPHELALYADPRNRLAGVRVLVMTNGSPDRSGRPLKYAETVPAAFDDPIEAAAWQYGCSADTYRQLQRRT
jgi:hypothetical protein